MIDWGSDRIVITGGAGFVGTHLASYIRELRPAAGNRMSILDSGSGDLRVLANCMGLLRRGDVVFHLAGDVGAIAYSSAHNATQLFNNAVMGLNVFEACRSKEVKKLIVASSICAYPDDSPVPFREEGLHRGEPTWSNYGYGTAKRLLVSLARCYSKDYGMDAVVLLGTNVYGPGDNFEPGMSHVIPSLVRQFVENDSVTVWGDGSSSRDFLYVRDYVRALVLASERVAGPDPINVGSGKETKVSEVIDIITKLISYRGKVGYDPKGLVGQSRRAVDISKARKLLGYEPEYSIERGISATLDWYLGEHGISKAALRR